MTPTRRTVLGVTAASTVVAAGCLGLGLGAPDADRESDGGGDGTDDGTGTGDGRTDDPEGGDEDSVPVLTGHAVSDAAVTPATERYSDMDPWALFLTTRAGAREYFGDVAESGAEAVREFVDETAFETGDRLLYVHAYAPGTCYELVLEEEPHVAENGIPLVETTVTRTAPADEPCSDAVSSVRSLVRLSFDRTAGSTDVVAVHVSGLRGDPEELLVERER